MLVELGTPRPVARHDGTGPVITYLHIPDTLSFNREVDAEDWRRHLQTHQRSLMRSPVLPAYEGSEVLCQLTHPNGPFNAVSDSDPTWVWSNDKDVARFCSEFYQIPVEARDPNDLTAGHSLGIDETHWRRVGGRVLAPGVPFIPDLNALLLNNGATLVADNVGGGQVGLTGTATATTATSLTSGTVTSLTANQYARYRLYTPTAWANIVSHTSGTTPVFTIDQWYVYASPGGAAATTPASTTTYVIADGGMTSAWYMGLTTTNITPAATDVTLSGEATTNGMSRKIATYTVTSAASGSSITFTVSTTFTFSGSTATTFYAMGLFASNVKSANNDAVSFFWETLFSGSFTVTNPGDTATVTDTITAS
jgi:hypothetical protein